MQEEILVKASEKNINPKRKEGKRRKPRSRAGTAKKTERKFSIRGVDAIAKGKFRMSRSQRRLWALEKFLLKVVVMVVPVYLIITFGISLGPVQLEVARESHWVLGAAGFNAILYGAGIVTEFAGKPPFFFNISADCTGWKAMLFFAALLLAVPRRQWRTRVAGLAAGIAAIWVINIFRVLAVVATYSSCDLDAAMLVHDYVWQVGMGLAALLLWVLWLRLSGKKSRSM